MIRGLYAVAALAWATNVGLAAAGVSHAPWLAIPAAPLAVLYTILAAR